MAKQKTFKQLDVLPQVKKAIKDVELGQMKSEQAFSLDEGKTE